MTTYRHTYGIVIGETPPLLHRPSAMSGRTQCGRPIVVVAGRPNQMAVCKYCTTMDEFYGVKDG